MRWVLVIGLFLSLVGFAQVTNGPTNGAGVVTNGAETNDFLAEAARAEELAAQEEPGAGEWLWVVVRIFLYTGAFAVGGFFLVRYVMKKSAVETTADASFIEVVAIKQTGLGGYLEVVKVGMSYYILGTGGDGGVRLIDKITDKETIDYIEMHKDKLKPKPQEFMSLLRMFPFTKKVDRTKYLQSQRDRLKKL